MLILGFAMGSLTADPADELFLLAFIPLPIVFVINLVLLARNGQTIGKKALGIKIVRDNRQTAGLGRIFVLRMIAPAVLGVIPIIGFFFGLANVLCIFREDRRCIHDFMADTVVVTA